MDFLGQMLRLHLPHVYGSHLHKTNTYDLMIPHKLEVKINVNMSRLESHFSTLQWAPCISSQKHTKCGTLHLGLWSCGFNMSFHLNVIYFHNFLWSRWNSLNSGCHVCSRFELKRWWKHKMLWRIERPSDAWQWRTKKLFPSLWCEFPIKDGVPNFCLQVPNISSLSSLTTLFWKEEEDARWLWASTILQGSSNHFATYKCSSSLSRPCHVLLPMK
jgi:hypothetical protein